MEDVILHGWLVELDDNLNEFEIFAGIKPIFTQDGKMVIIGVAEKWDSASRPSGSRFVNIKITKQ